LNDKRFFPASSVSWYVRGPFSGWEVTLPNITSSGEYVILPGSCMRSMKGEQVNERKEPRRNPVYNLVRRTAENAYRLDRSVAGDQAAIAQNGLERNCEGLAIHGARDIGCPGQMASGLDRARPGHIGKSDRTAQERATGAGAAPALDRSPTTPLAGLVPPRPAARATPRSWLPG